MNMEHTHIETADASPAFASFSADPTAISQAVDLLARHVVERRNSVPILSYLRIEADAAGTLAIEACDLDQSCSVTIAADVATPGTFCLDAGALQATLAKLRKVKGLDAVRIDDSGEGRAAIIAQRNRYNVPTLPANDFPRVHGPAGEGDAPLSRFALPAGQFLADLAALSPCMSKDEARYYLNGIALQRRDLAGRDRLVMVATDGHGMAIAARAAPDGAEALADAILPACMVRTIGKAVKLIGTPDAVAVAIDAERVTITAGPVTITAKLIAGTYPDWGHGNLWGEGGSCAPTDGEAAALFPDLLPGAPVAMLEKLAKPFKGAMSWAPASNAMLGTVAGDDGLLFAAMNMAGTKDPRKGFTYATTGTAEAQAYLLALAEARGLPLPADIRAICEGEAKAYNRDSGKLHMIGARVIGMTVSGERWIETSRETALDWERLVEVEIVTPEHWEPIEGSYSILMPADGPQPEYSSVIEGPDGVAYPVAMSETAIHFNRDQVRALIGESCFETMEVQPGCYVLRWLWEQGDGRFLIVGKDGRVKGAHRTYMTRAEVEAALAGEPAPIPVQAVEAVPTETPEILASAPDQDESAPIAAHDDAEAVEALSEALSGPAEPSGDTGQLLADVLARLADVEARLAGLSAEAGPICEIAVDYTKAIQPAPIRAARTPAHERAIRRAWAERKARQAREFNHRMTRDRLENANGSIAYWRDLAEGETMRANRAEQKRRRAVLNTRATLSRLRAMRQSHTPIAVAQAMIDQARATANEWETAWKIADKDLRDATEHADRETARANVLAAQLAKAGDDLAAARRVQTYCDEAGRHAPDTIGNTAAHARTAIEKAQGLERQLGEAHAAIARQDKAMDGLADAMEAATLRAIRAETALAAVKARRDGWPPAVRNVSVSFAA